MIKPFVKTAFFFCVAAIIFLVGNFKVSAGYFDYNDVLLVINDSSPDSVTIGNYFKAQRNIPTVNVVHITTSSSEIISRALFNSQIKTPIENYLTTNNLTNSINYIVLTKGIPLQITSVGSNDNASPDSELTLILGSSTASIGGSGAVSSSYYQARAPFSRSVYGTYLVTRLDGYSTTSVISLINRSANATTTNTGKFILDVDPTKDGGVYQPQNDQMRAASPILTDKGYTTILNQTTTYLTAQTGVLGYWSWGSNDANAPFKAIPGNTYTNGAIGDTAVSTSARTFTSPATYGQSLIADLVEEGISGVQGYSAEPYTYALSHSDILFDRYTSGYNFADSMYMSTSNNLSWQNIVLGDPKMVVVKTTKAPVLVLPAEGEGIATQNTTFSWLPSIAYQGVSKYQLYIDGALAIDNIASTTTSVSTTTPTTAGIHTWYVKVTDAVSTATSSPTRTFSKATDIVLTSSSTDMLGHFDYSTSLSNPSVSYIKSSYNDGPGVLGMGSPSNSIMDSVHHRFFVADEGNFRILVYALNTDNTFIDRAPDFILGQVDFNSNSGGATQSKFSSISSFAYDSTGDRLFISDYLNNRVLVYDTATIVNGENAINVLGQANFTATGAGTTQNTMNSPLGLAYHALTNRLFVADSSNSRVLVYDVASITNGENAVNVLGQITFTSVSVGPTQGLLTAPGGIAFDSAASRLFVTDSTDNRVVIYDVASITNGENAIGVLGATDYITSTGGTTQSTFTLPSGIVYASTTNRLFVSDYGNNRVMVFSAATTTNGQNATNVLGQNTFLTTDASSTQSGINGNSGVSYDDVNQKLFVADSANYRILVYDVVSITNGENATDVLGHSTGESLTNPQPYFTKNEFADGSDDGIKNFTLRNPTYSLVDSSNHRLFVSDTANARILVYGLSTDNTLINRTAQYVLGKADFVSAQVVAGQAGGGNPQGLAYDSAGNRLFVADYSKNRILVYDVASITNGENAVNVLGQANFISSTATTTQSGMNSPQGIVYNSSTNLLYVADTNNNRVLIYDVASITNGENAVNVLGKSTFTSSVATSTQSGTSAIRGLAHDNINNRLFVVDSGNNRVLIYDVASITNGENAVNVLGQANFTSRTSAVTRGGVSSPYGISYDSLKNRIFVANANRVTVYDASSVSDGQLASNVIGQTNFTSSTAATTQGGMSSPEGLFYDQTSGRLYVGDTINNRVTIWSAGVPSIVASKTSASVSKSGSIDTIAIQLASQPTASVTVTASSSNTSVASISPLSFIFTTTTWNVPQTLTVTGVNSALYGQQASITTLIINGGSSSPEYANAGNVIINVTTTDTDSTLVTTTPASPSTSVIVTSSGGGYFVPNNIVVSTTTRNTSTSTGAVVPLSNLSSLDVSLLTTMSLHNSYFAPITKSLVPGTKVKEVISLQKKLNMLGFTIATTGAGSPGKETNFYGILTKEAIKRFQEKYAKEILSPVGLSKGTGYFGPLTRKKLNSLTR